MRNNPVRNCPRRVLVADDSDILRTALRTMLVQDGYAVDEAPDGAGALDVLRASPSGIVALLDWNMPHLDGVGVLHAVAADGALAAQHAYLLMTASDPATLPAEAAALLARLGGEALAKPFDVGVLLDAVARAAARLPD